MVGRYVLCFCGGVVTLLLGMAAGLGVILFWQNKMMRIPQRPPQRRLSRWDGEENAPRGAHAERRAMY